MLERVWRKGNPLTLLVGVQIDTANSSKEYWSGLPCPPPGIFLTQGLNPSLPHCRQILYCPSNQEAQEYWSDSLFLLQEIFLPQESNQSLLHCRRILYQLSYQGSLENSIEVPLKSRNEATIQPSKSTTEHILSEKQN